MYLFIISMSRIVPILLYIFIYFSERKNGTRTLNNRKAGRNLINSGFPFYNLRTKYTPFHVTGKVFIYSVVVVQEKIKKYKILRKLVVT